MGTTRRRFLGQSVGFGVALGAGIPILQGCGGDDDGADQATGDAATGTGDTTTSATTGAPGTTVGERQVTESIADGLEPEAGPLRIFNYADYVNPDIVAKFEEQYGVAVEITTFDVDAEAINKLATGAVEVDVHHTCVPSTLERLVLGGLLQPLIIGGELAGLFLVSQELDRSQMEGIECAHPDGERLEGATQHDWRELEQGDPLEQVHRRGIQPGHQPEVADHESQ